MTAGELWRRGQHGWPRRFPIVQFPNPPLLFALGGFALAETTDGTTHDVGRVIFIAGLVLWAWEEAAGGVNWLRRLLGAGVLVWIVVALIGRVAAD